MSKPLDDPSRPLNEPKHERFAQFVAQGKSKRDAAIAANFSQKHASSIGTRLSKRAKVGQRIDYLKRQIAEKTVDRAVKLVDLEIAAKINRIKEQNRRWELMNQVIAERAADKSMENVPGGKTGLVVRQIKAVGTGASQKLVPEYAVDTGLLRELRAHEEQAAKELGQFVEKREMRLNVRELTDEQLAELAGIGEDS